MSALGDLRYPLVLAPLAGGPSTPELAAAVCEAGGLGFLACGYLTGADTAEQIARTRTLTDRPSGVPGAMGNITGNQRTTFAVQSLWSNEAAAGTGFCAGAGTDLPF
jgi:NAD(P)H-dependent flavin oxidoreductase YrpB (nitropropane dioxygenase family)